MKKYIYTALIMGLFTSGVIASELETYYEDMDTERTTQVTKNVIAEKFSELTELLQEMNAHKGAPHYFFLRVLANRALCIKKDADTNGENLLLKLSKDDTLSATRPKLKQTLKDEAALKKIEASIQKFNQALVFFAKHIPTYKFDFSDLSTSELYDQIIKQLWATYVST